MPDKGHFCAFLQAKVVFAKIGNSLQLFGQSTQLRSVVPLAMFYLYPAYPCHKLGHKLTKCGSCWWDFHDVVLNSMLIWCWCWCRTWWCFLGRCSSHHYFGRGTTWVCSVIVIIIIIIIIMSGCRTGLGWWHNTSEARTWCSPAAPSRPYCKNRLPSSPLFFAWSLCIRICWWSMLTE